MAQPTDGMVNHVEIIKDACTEEFSEKHLNSLKSLTTALRLPDFRYFTTLSNLLDTRCNISDATVAASLPAS